MFPDTLLAIARISEINRELSQPMTTHRREAARQHSAAQRARRYEKVTRLGRAVSFAVRGQRIGRTATAA